MAMNTTYNGGGVQTTTDAGGLPALPGYSGGGMPNFFQIMAMRQEEERQAQNRASHAAHEERLRQNLAAQRASGDRMGALNSFAKVIPAGPGILGGAIQAHAGDPGAVMGGWIPQGAEQGHGGDMTNVGIEGDLMRAKKEALDFGAFKQRTEQPARG